MGTYRLYTLFITLKFIYIHKKIKNKNIKLVLVYLVPTKLINLNNAKILYTDNIIKLIIIQMLLGY